VVTLLQQSTAALYLLAGALGAAGLALSRPALARAAVWALAVGCVAHGLVFSLLHTLDPPPPLNDLPSALSFMAWVGTASFLLLAWRTRLLGLVVLVAPMSFLGVFAAWLTAGTGTGGGDPIGAGSLPHAHVLLASAGLGLLGLAGLAGLLYLVEHRRLKRKRPLGGASGLPSLEALDRAGALAVAVGFPLLSLGVLTGALWQQAVLGVPFGGSAHETLCLVAWGVYGVLAALRFGANQPARRCAWSSLAGFALLGLVVLGAEWLT